MNLSELQSEHFLFNKKRHRRNSTYDGIKYNKSYDKVNEKNENNLYWINDSSNTGQTTSNYENNMTKYKRKMGNSKENNNKSYHIIGYSQDFSPINLNRNQKSKEKDDDRDNLIMSLNEELREINIKYNKLKINFNIVQNSEEKLRLENEKLKSNNENLQNTIINMNNIIEENNILKN